MWECRLCGSQNDRTDLVCGVCGKGVYPRDAVVAGKPGPPEPAGKRGIGAVITPGAAPPVTGGAFPAPDTRVAAAPAAAPVPARRSRRRRAVIVVVVLLLLIAIAVAIAIAAADSGSYSAAGALAASTVLLPAVRWEEPGSPPGGPSRR
jgi:hypothetical protein